jgi:hypothetical protein
MYCRQCGAHLNQEALYCPKCGAKNDSTSTPQNPLEKKIINVEVIAGTPPQSVILACRLLWISLVLESISTDLSLDINGQMIGQYKNLVTLLSIIITLLEALFIIKIKARKNWARVVMLILFISSLIGSFAGSKGAYPELFLVIDLIAIGLTGIAIFLLFNSSSSKWFSQKTILIDT